MKVVSFFAGCGGLDLGFRQAGFEVVWANEYDGSIHQTYRLNHPDTVLNTSDIRALNIDDIPDCDGFIGGPPCQSWSLGGSMRGLDDDRGKLFLNYIDIIKTKKPKFFLIENVAGLVSDKHFKTFHGFITSLSNAGYCVSFATINAADFEVPQDRIRVFIVGIRNDMSFEYRFPTPITSEKHLTLKHAIGDITENPRFYNTEPVLNDHGKWSNHDSYSGPYDKKYMARNRVRKWDETSFTIQAQARNAPLHPQAPPMIYVSPDERRFDTHHLDLYRRLSVRECARIQTFPDSFHFYYNNIQDGYKMVGNAVPPMLAKHLAIAIKEQVESAESKVNATKAKTVLVGYYRDDEQLRLTKEHKLYYVRTGFRPGAMQIPPGEKSPDMLLLHRKDKIELFSLRQNPPIIKTYDELKDLGFKPHGDVYLCFLIKEFVCLPKSKINGTMKQSILQSTVPYITKYDSIW